MAPPLKFEEVDRDEAIAPLDAHSHTSNGPAFSRWDATWKSPTKNKVYCTFQARGCGSIIACVSKTADVPAPNGNQAYVAQLVRSIYLWTLFVSCARVFMSTSSSFWFADWAFCGQQPVHLGRQRRSRLAKPQHVLLSADLRSDHAVESNLVYVLHV